jgi:hypothetical protein
MKKLFLIVLLFASLVVQSQYSLRLMQYRPTGLLGSGMKKAVAGEIIYLQNHLDIDTKIRSRYGVGFVKMNPRLDTFRLVSYEVTYDGPMVYPGYEVYHKFNFTYGFIGIDYLNLSKGKFSFYPGVDGLVGVFGYDRQSQSHGSSLGESGGYGVISLRFRAGVLYELNEQINVHLETNRAYYYGPEIGSWSANDIGLTFQYIVN